MDNQLMNYVSGFTFQVSRITSALAWFVLALSLPASAQPSEDKQATFFMGRIRYSANDGNDCAGIAQGMMSLVSRASTLKVQEERKVRLTDPDLFETPFLFMNGHNDFVFTQAEIENLKKYLSHGGFFFGSGCCTNPNFPKGQTDSVRSPDLSLLLQNRARPLSQRIARHPARRPLLRRQPCGRHVR